MGAIRAADILREVRHPLWTPRSWGGETPILNGTGAVAANDWQPIDVGMNDHTEGADPNTVVFRADGGRRMTLSGLQFGDTIVDMTSPGDAGTQMRSVRHEVPGPRTFGFNASSGWGWLEAFFATVFDDPLKRPFELRETFLDWPAIAAGKVEINNSAGYAAASTGALTVDGDDADETVVGQLVTIGTGATVYRVVARTDTSITLDKPLVAQASDDDDVLAAARQVRSIEYLLVQQVQLSVEPKEVLVGSVECVAYKPMTRFAFGG